MGKVLAGELPLKGSSRGFPVVLKIQEALGEVVEIGKVVGGKDLSLDNREIDFDLVEPTGMNGGVYQHETGIQALQSLGGFGATVSRTVVDDPEDAAGFVIGRPRHDLLNEIAKRRDSIVLFTATKDSGLMYVQCRDIGPCPAAVVLVLDMHGLAWPAGVREMLAAAGLNAGLFIGRDHKLILLQAGTLPLTSIEVQNASCLGGEIGIAWKDPTAVIPRSNGVIMEPAPQRTTANRGH